MRWAFSATVHEPSDPQGRAEQEQGDVGNGLKRVVAALVVGAVLATGTSVGAQQPPRPPEPVKSSV